MVASARRKLLGGERQAVFHCWNRCVRRAFLCGRDSHTGTDYSHRRDWILDREEQLARLFAIDTDNDGRPTGSGRTRRTGRTVG